MASISASTTHKVVKKTTVPKPPSKSTGILKSGASAKTKPSGVASSSVVLHSHNYTFLGALRRYFDSAFSLTQIFRRHDLSQSARMGSSYLRREASMMLRNHPLLLPRYAAYVLAKTLGTVLGHFADRLPLCLVRRLSLHSAYWSSPPSTQPHPPSSP